MDVRNDNNVIPESHAVEEPNKELLDAKTENDPSHVTSFEKEMIESDETGFPSKLENDSDALDLVHKYASKIKSFLGWEPTEDELKHFNAQAESANGISNSEGGILNEDNEQKLLPHGIKAEPSFQTTLSKENINYFQDDSNRESENRILIENIPEIMHSGKMETTEFRGSNVADGKNSVLKIEASSENNPENNLEEKKTSHTNSPNLFDGNISEQIDHTTNEDLSSNSNECILKETEGSSPNNSKAEVHLSEDRRDSLIEQSEETLAEDVSDMKDINCGNEISNENSDDIIHSDQSVSLQKNIHKPYMDDIRRLSLDIVKEVIDSARSSMHEIFSKSEPNKELLCEVDKIAEDHLKNGTPEEKMSLEIDFSNEKYENNLSGTVEYNNGQIELNAKDVDTDDDTVCGFGSFRPQWIQKYAKPRIYLLLFSVMGVIHGTYYSYFVSVITTLEKRYAFNSKISGLLLLADEITPLFLGIFVGYIGGKTHRPRMVALGMFMSVACCFITAFPYIIYGSKHLSFEDVKIKKSTELCDNGIEESCEPDERSPTMTVVGLFLLASFLKGFATLSYYVIGVPYMDDNAKKKNTPLYLSIALALRLLGPLLGYLMSSIFLKFYENPFEDPGFGPDDPRWIGAWWIGFILQGVLLVICTLPIALFPRRLPNHRKPELKASSAKKESIKEMFSGLVDALKRLGKNPVFVFMAINTVLTIFGHFGHAIMLPKYMENQFKLSASDASLFSGATSVACMMVSTVLGGFLMWKFRPSSKLLLKGMIASEITMCIGYLCLMLPQCQLNDMSNFGKNDLGLILNGQCNQNCDCTTAAFTPFCGEDGKTMYFSPCYAGCTQQLTLFMSEKEKKGFGNCSCVADEDGAMVGQVTEGFCPDENCWTQTLAYICLLLFLITISSSLTVAHTMILLRSVHPSDKSLALGTFETFCCLFGFIPFPITYGAIVDSACLVWEKSCGQTGNCWFYDMTKYRYMLHGFSSFFCFLTVFCFISLYCLRSRIRNLYEEEHDDKEEPVTIKLDTVSGSVTKL